uniref:EGF-like domain-containing protein n=1 Tax=Ciona savignyi TaxID=51511 RepID=H2Y497_CIOSA
MLPGCYVNIGAFLLSSPNMTVDKCIKACQDGPGTPFASLSFQECRCLSAEPSSTVVPCNMRCQDGRLCGSSDGATVYRTGSGHSCSCKSGFTGNGYNCTDIDECTVSPSICSGVSNSMCVNTPGSYSCDCTTGFFKIGSRCLNYTVVVPCDSSETNIAQNRKEYWFQNCEG